MSTFLSRSGGSTRKSYPSNDLWPGSILSLPPWHSNAMRPPKLDFDDNFLGGSFEKDDVVSVWSDDESDVCPFANEDSEDGSFFDTSDTESFGLNGLQMIQINPILTPPESILDNTKDSPNDNVQLPPLSSLNCSMEKSHQFSLRPGGDIKQDQVDIKQDSLTEKLAHLRKELEVQRTGAVELELDRQPDIEIECEENDKHSFEDAFSRISRKQFRDTIGNDFYSDLVSGQYSYEEIIAKYQKLYPEHASKFTRNFCSKVRCGRILVSSKSSKQRSVKNGDPRMRRITKISNRKMWAKMTPKLFSKIYEWEKQQVGPVKQVQIENLFNVNRSTYYRWKRRNEANTQICSPPKEKRCHDN